MRLFAFTAAASLVIVGGVAAASAATSAPADLAATGGTFGGVTRLGPDHLLAAQFTMTNKSATAATGDQTPTVTVKSISGGTIIDRFCSYRGLGYNPDGSGCEKDGLPRGASAVMLFTVRPAAGVTSVRVVGCVTDNATGSLSDPNIGNNCATITVSVS